MDDPVNQIKGVIRSLIEPYRHAVVGENVSKYFTPDATISNPLWIHTKLSKSDIHVKSIYEILRLFSINNRVEFQGVMFDETNEHCTLELVETMDSILHYNFLSNVSIPLLIRLDLTKGADGKYWISKEKSNIPTDLKMIGMVLFPSLISIGKILGLTAGIGTGAIGRAVPITSS
ncbi:hypothetical protein PGTUg99_008508 [Puccinia graminis f. sp. tritici]|uniref:SigF-like NTF2-like domain-containing protein n=1 Tax=Puccinia graminis f. sp. tritici TaxID=56615 RepID=A0A5B0PLN2_PUCGR|nr:hypothetical protein PGTUg99_008508 [Puccinia graminis f. sp. tritici]